MEVLDEICVRKPLWLQGMKFRELFSWLSNSQQAVSRSSPGDEVPLAGSDRAQGLGPSVGSSCVATHCPKPAGPSHAADDSPCQDSNSVLVLDDDASQTLVACVADGAGSAKYSDVGSAIVCNTIVESASAFLNAGGSFDELAAARRAALVRRGPHADSARGGRPQLRSPRAGHHALRRDRCARAILLFSDRRRRDHPAAERRVRRRVLAAIGRIRQLDQFSDLAPSTTRSSSSFRSTTRCSDIALMTDGLERLALRFDTRLLTRHFSIRFSVPFGRPKITQA